MNSATMGEWMNPLNKLIFQKAVKNKETKVTIKNGQTFEISYDWRDNPKLVWIRITPDFVPCGEFKVDEILSGMWLTGDK